MASLIETEPIFEVDSCDNPTTRIVGFYCNGHIEEINFLNYPKSQEYVQEYNEYREPDFQPELMNVTKPGATYLLENRKV